MDIEDGCHGMGCIRRLEACLCIVWGVLSPDLYSVTIPGLLALSVVWDLAAARHLFCEGLEGCEWGGCGVGVGENR